MSHDRTPDVGIIMGGAWTFPPMNTDGKPPAVWGFSRPTYKFNCGRNPAGVRLVTILIYTPYVMMMMVDMTVTPEDFDDRLLVEYQQPIKIEIKQ